LLLTAIGIDKNNNKWIGTHGNVLFFYNGNEFKQLDNSITNIPFKCSINNITFDKNDNMWITTLGGGIVKKDQKEWTNFRKENSGLPSNYINAITFNYDTTWIATTEGLVKYYNYQWQTYTKENSTLPHNTIYDLCFDNQGILWIATQEGLAKYKNGWIPFNNDLITNKFVTDVSVDNNNTIWIGTDFSLESFDGKNWKVNWKYKPEDPFDAVLINNIIFDEYQNKWFIGFGLCVYREGGVI
jgi:ligand-binding sensor domain-containing protein